MNIAGLFRRKSERRDYASDVAAYLTNAASGATGFQQAAETAAVEGAVGCFARAFAVASVTPFGDVFTPELNALLVRRLLLLGNAVCGVQVDALGNLAVLPASSYDIGGGANPKSWIYSLTFDSPSGQDTVVLPAPAVVHIRINAPSGARWRGVSPLESAGISSALLSRLEQRLADESKARVGYLLPIPELGDTELDALKTDLTSLAGNVALVQSSAMDGRETGGQADWTPRRFGATLPPGNVQARGDVGIAISAALGLPPALSGSSDGTALREGFRQFLSASVRPYAALFEAELSRVMEQPIRYDFRSLRASDVTGNARAFHILKLADMDTERALQLSGLVDA